MIDLIEDISRLTTIKRYNLEQLSDKVELLIGHAIAEDPANTEFTIDMGFGKLLIQRSCDDVRYRFIPSNRLEGYVRDAYISGKCPLTEKIEEELGRRIQKTYKDLF